ncbi:phosphodiester glycosidase family protein [Metabacillus iocasae]|uniref:Exopolysaccharide biosynthesis protein n=1 Tax=Priestia iocasae TaxID=2291674 RepID=A0ABS2QWX2_9BACI|nr:phosphodiester glycosidase family protein [Metabacillus iocasae]MBM7703980.1 exopolysaccharide biosynthesis protein [Metabacillus iocasae]
MKWKKALLATLLSVQVVAVGLPAKEVEANVSSGTVKENVQVTPGVKYQDIRHGGTTPQAVRVMEVNMADPYTKVEVGLSNPVTKRSSVTNLAKAQTYEGHAVVGAINASFFHMSNGLPAYLLAVKNTIVNLGVISTGFDEYMSIPTAFGIANDGKPLIDKFAYEATFTHNNNPLRVSSINKERSASEVIVYTPQFSYTSTRTNTYGMEIVVTNVSKPVDQGLTFGEVVTGTVQAVTSYGQGNSIIPENGFVLSVQGGALAATLSDIKAGDPIQLTIDMEPKWKNAEYILASGPMLVQDSKVSMTIDPNSPRSKERHPRTAVAVDKTRNKVFFVTVDGRQSGYAAGMTLPEFAHYLVSLGADRALNLDGGGSTTMAVRQVGHQYATLANRPSQTAERAISTALHAVSTAPVGDAVRFHASLKQESPLTLGSSVEIEITNALDRYNNVVPVDLSKVTLKTEGSLEGTFNGLRFTPTKVGEGSIVVMFGQTAARLPLKVIDSLKGIAASPSRLTIGENASAQLMVSGIDEAGKSIPLSSSLVKWSISTNIGTVSSAGQFKANGLPGTGTITATYRDHTASIPVTIGGQPTLVSSLDDVTQWTSSAARSTASITSSEHITEGKSAVKLQYDFTSAQGEIAAGYANAKQPIAISGAPSSLGVWVYGDGAKHWLRGKIIDGSGNEHTLNFTAEGGLDWTGWKHVRATIPNNLPLPLTFKQIYVAEVYKERQGKGALTFDSLQAFYQQNPTVTQPKPAPVNTSFKDVPSTHWAYKEIGDLVQQGVITGYEGQIFKPENSLTRMHAALLLAKALKLDTSTPVNPNYHDVPTTHMYYNVIATVANKGIMTGKGKGTFDPTGTLSRAQMSAILTRAYKLTGTITKDFNDVPATHWAYKDISALAANKVTVGYESDHTFRPEQAVSRAQFSAFLYRVNK